jgi:hypothetical protein
MLGVLAWPEAEAIVMLCSQNQPSQATIFGSTHNAVSIKPGWIEKRWAFIPVAPLFISKCVDGEVDEGIHPAFVPSELAGSWQRSKRLWGINRHV